MQSGRPLWVSRGRDREEYCRSPGAEPGPAPGAVSSRLSSAPSRRGGLGKRRPAASVLSFEPPSAGHGRMVEGRLRGSRPSYGESSEVLPPRRRTPIRRCRTRTAPPPVSVRLATRQSGLTWSTSARSANGRWDWCSGGFPKGTRQEGPGTPVLHWSGGRGARAYRSMGSSARGRRTRAPSGARSSR